MRAVTHTPPLYPTKKHTERTHEIATRSGEKRLQKSSFFDLELKKENQLMITPNNPIGLKVDTRVKVAPILKHMSPKGVV